MLDGTSTPAPQHPKLPYFLSCASSRRSDRILHTRSKLDSLNLTPTASSATNYLLETPYVLGNTRNPRTPSPGATISGLIRLSVDGPYELKNETVSMSARVSSADVSSSPSMLVAVNRVTPEDDDPTASTFLPMAGLPIVHTVLEVAPSLPAAKINRCSGFLGYQKRGLGRRQGAQNRVNGGSKTNCTEQKIASM